MMVSYYEGKKEICVLDINTNMSVLESVVTCSGSASTNESPINRSVSPSISNTELGTLRLGFPYTDNTEGCSLTRESGKNVRALSSRLIVILFGSSLIQVVWNSPFYGIGHTNG